MALTDTNNHPPPTTGPYPYSCNSPPLGGTWYPNQSGFPALGETYVDPIFGQTVRRLTSNLGATAGEQLIYAWNGQWNADATYRAVDDGSNNGVVNIINPISGATIRTAIPFDGNADPDEFDPNYPDIFYYPSGTTIRKYSVAGNSNSLVKDFGVGNTVGSLGGTSGKIDDSGRYWVIHIGANARVWDGIDGSGRLPGDPSYVPQATGLGNVYTGNLTASYGGGYASMSPDAAAVFIANDSVPELRWHTINHGAQTVNTTGVQRGQLLGGDHGDVCWGSNGKIYWVTAETPGGEWILTAYNLTDGGSQTLLQIGNNNFDEDFSGIKRGLYRDWVVCTLSTTPVDDFSQWQHFHQEVWMVHSQTGAVRRLCHHRSRGAANGSDGYIRTARVSVNRDGTYAAFASSYGNQSATPFAYADAWTVTVADPSDSPPVAPMNLGIFSTVRRISLSY